MTSAEEKNRSSSSHSYCVNGYQIEINSSTPYSVIENIWINLEEKSNPPFFLSWAWISTWISTYSPKLITVTATFDNSIVAMGLFTASTEIRHKIIRSHQLRLHQVGCKLKDQIWIEYNDFICSNKHRTNSVNACLKALQKKDFIWDEIIISMQVEKRSKEISAAFKHSFLDESQPCYETELAQLQKSNDGYLKSLSKNTRHQISKATRLYKEKYGPLVTHTAHNLTEALRYFHEAGEFHTRRWIDSGYKNSYFVKFHEELIKKNFNNNCINLHKIMAGERTIGILYFHLKGKKVYFYLQGLQTEVNPKLKPGLVAHSLVTQYYKDSGYESYDYMAGSSQYKTQLSKHKKNITSIKIRRPRLKFYLEDLARFIKKTPYIAFGGNK